MAKKLSEKVRKARKKPGGSNVGKYPNVAKKDFAGPAGGAPAGSFPINTKRRAVSAAKLRFNAPDPEGIEEAINKKYPNLIGKKKDIKATRRKARGGVGRAAKAVAVDKLKRGTLKESGPGSVSPSLKPSTSKKLKETLEKHLGGFKMVESRATKRKSQGGATQKAALDQVDKFFGKKKKKGKK